MWVTKFSDIIGASHTGSYRFWRYGEVATDGLKEVAERGNTTQLESELKSQVRFKAEEFCSRGVMVASCINMSGLP